MAQTSSKVQGHIFAVSRAETSATIGDPLTLSLAMIIFQANGHFGHLPYPLSPFRFERYMTPYASEKDIRVLGYATASLRIGAVEGG